tara:strand:- start:10372 stop:11316 length:945 start_codon:yes stop_codon:yes gene_type:complete
MPQRSVLVLGGNGFIGRHAAAALINAGVHVIIGTRFAQRKHSWHALHPAVAKAPQREVRLEQLADADDWLPVIENVDAVLNCVGILRQRGRETYDAIHRQAPAALAAACKSQRKRFVHVSALGLEKPAKSRFLTSKLAGEKAIAEHGEDWLIARPSLLDGVGGFGASWLRGVARLPLFVIPADATGRIAALDVADLGEALAHLTLKEAATLRLDESRIFELGGTESWHFREYILSLRRTYTKAPALCVPIPGLLARLGAHLCDVLHFTPFSFGHWELLRRDNIPVNNRLPELLGRAPVSVVSRNVRDQEITGVR